MTSNQSELTPKEILDKLNPYQYRYNKMKDLGNQINFGFMAQDLLESFGSDYAFVDTTDEYYKVNYHQFIGILTSVVKEQQQELDALKIEMKNLKEAKNEQST